MPIVTIQVTREGTTPDRASVSAEEKAALIKGVSELLRDVLDKPLKSTFVLIEEVDTDNWGWGGLPVLEYGAARRGERCRGHPTRRRHIDCRARGGSAGQRARPGAAVRSRRRRSVAMTLPSARRLLELLDIERPIIQAPMAGVSTPAMAAAVSNAGDRARSASAP